MNNISLLSQIIELAQDGEINDPIDWGMLQVDENSAYLLIANGLVDLFGYPDTQREMLILASLVRTTVENFTLHLKLLGDPT